MLRYFVKTNELKEITNLQGLFQDKTQPFTEPVGYTEITSIVTAQGIQDPHILINQASAAGESLLLLNNKIIQANIGDFGKIAKALSS